MKIPTMDRAEAHICECHAKASGRNCKGEKRVRRAYSTKRVILDIYAVMNQPVATDTPYQIRLDRSPASPRCCHPAKE